MFHRRSFPKSCLLYIVFLLIFFGFEAPTAYALERVRVLKSDVSGVKKSYSIRKMPDPTGTAPSARVERFELRGGLCKASDCEYRPSTRSRIERQSITALKEGGEAWFLYSILFPSKEFTPIPYVRTTFGQLFLNRDLSTWDGVPIWELQTDRSGKVLYVQMKRADPEDRLPKKRTFVGTLGKDLSYDRWIDVKVHIKLSSGSDGFLKTYINSKLVAQLNAPTTWKGAHLEYDYGIYQSGTSDWVDKTGRSLSAIPHQAVYYSGVGFGRVDR